MRYLLLIGFTAFSFSACSKEKTKEDSKIIKSSKESNKIVELKKEAPCESKEDILKKLEEKKKSEEEKGKAFSLQGGNTGCSVK